MKRAGHRILASSLVLLALARAASAQEEGQAEAMQGAAGSGQVGKHSALELAADPELLSSLELPDWKAPSHGSTLAVATACGVRWEARMLGTYRRNFLFLKAMNLAGGRRVLSIAGIRAAVGDPADAQPLVPDHPGSPELKPGAPWVLTLSFPSKGQFERADRVRVEVPVRLPDMGGECIAAIELSRPDVPRSEGTSLSWAKGVVGLEVGSSLAIGGDLGKVASRGLDLQFAAQRFISPRHGFHIGFAAHGMGGGNALALAPATGAGVRKGPELVGMNLSLGYAYRRFPSPETPITYSIAPGIYQFTYNQLNQAAPSTSFALSATQRLSFEYVFSRTYPLRTLDLDQAVGLTAAHLWLPNASIGPVSARGHQLSLLARYQLGF